MFSPAAPQHSPYVVNDCLYFPVPLLQVYTTTWTSFHTPHLSPMLNYGVA